MGLNASFPDKGRILSQSETAVRIEGTKQHVPETGDEFRCRLEMNKETEGSDQGRRRGIVRPSVIVGRKVRLDGKHDIAIKSKEVHGHEDWVRYSIDGDPEPYRKKTTVIGWEAYIVRVK